MVRYNTRHYTKTFFYKQLFQMDEFFFLKHKLNVQIILAGFFYSKANSNIAFCLAL